MRERLNADWLILKIVHRSEVKKNAVARRRIVFRFCVEKGRRRSFRLRLLRQLQLWRLWLLLNHGIRKGETRILGEGFELTLLEQLGDAELVLIVGRLGLGLRDDRRGVCRVEALAQHDAILLVLLLLLLLLTSRLAAAYGWQAVFGAYLAHLLLLEEAVGHVGFAAAAAVRGRIDLGRVTAHVELHAAVRVIF